METIAISELRANLMKVITDVQHGSKIYITSRGKVVAKLVHPDEDKKSAKKRLKEISKTAILLDIISPIDVQWKVMK